jgi:hypothetical protein
MRQGIELHRRLLMKIEAAGPQGLTKTEIMQYAQTPVDKVNKALTNLLNEFLIVTGDAPEHRSMGRRPRVFWYKDYAPSLTPAAPDGTPVSQPDSDPPPGGTCRQCGGWTPIVLDRPRDFCSDQCQDLYRTGGVSRKSLLAQATDPRVYVDLCVLFVMEDLLLRGLLPNFDHKLAGSHILVHDGRGAWLLDVLAIPRDGLLPPLENYESVAIVFLDGRIRYAGKNPLVVEPAVEDNLSS